MLVREVVESGESVGILKQRMGDLGLRGGAWALPVDWRSDQAVFERHLAALPRLAAAAAELGLTRTGTWVLPAGILPGMTDGMDARERLLDQHADRLGRMATVLGREGTRLGLEVIGVETFRQGRGAPFLHRLGDPDLKRLIDRLNAERSAGTPEVGILLDSFHLHAADETVEQALGWFGVESVVWVHLADLPEGFRGGRSAILDHDRGLPGESDLVPCARVLESLAGAGYDGPVSVEPLAGCRSLSGLEPPEVAARCAEAMRRVWPKDSETRR